MFLTLIIGSHLQLQCYFKKFCDSEVHFNRLGILENSNRSDLENYTVTQVHHAHLQINTRRLLYIFVKT